MHVHIRCIKRRSAHAHVPSISLPDFYLSTPRMVMSVIIMQCVARKQIDSALFPTLHSFNVVLARPRSVHLASSQGDNK